MFEICSWNRKSDLHTGAKWKFNVFSLLPFLIWYEVMMWGLLCTDKTILQKLFFFHALTTFHSQLLYIFTELESVTFYQVFKKNFNTSLCTFSLLQNVYFCHLWRWHLLRINTSITLNHRGSRQNKWVW